jgi:arylsulfatase A
MEEAMLSRARSFERFLTCSLILCLLHVGRLSGADTAADGLPNIVIILADDLGYGDVACYNPDRGKIATPHTDALAAQGMRFTDGHSSSGVCSPSRYTLLTGRYHWRTRLQQGIVGLWGAPLIAEDRLTIAGLLKQHGYHTACVGKWHLGWDWPIEPGKEKLFRGVEDQDVTVTPAHRAAWEQTFSQAIPGGPITRGFDEYFGTDVPNWPPYCFIEQDRTRGLPTEFLPVRLFERNQASNQGPALAGWTLEPILPALGDRACDTIRRAAKREEPFFLYMPLTAPHTPLAVNDSWKGKSRLNLYADFVMETDAVVGQVLDALRENDVADNTLLIFTSDNGCAPYIGIADLEKMGHYPSGPLRGAKSDVWEGGHRVPFIVRWPGRVAAGSINHQLVHHADLMATCAAVVQTQLPPNAGEDSFSLLPLLLGEDEPVRTNAVSQSIAGLVGVRQGDWKLIFGPGSGGWGKGSDHYPAQLYNLAEDLGETLNLYAQQPSQVEALTELMEQLVQQRAQYTRPGTSERPTVQLATIPQAGDAIMPSCRP